MADIKSLFPKRTAFNRPLAISRRISKALYGGSVAKNQNDMDHVYEFVQNRFNKYPNVFLHRGKSEEVLPEFVDKYFDWVYIDGNHYYEFVLKDLMLRFDKVKIGGFITGDDYTWGEKLGFPVNQAIQDFIEEIDKDIRLEIIGSQFIIRV